MTDITPSAGDADTARIPPSRPVIHLSDLLGRSVIARSGDAVGRVEDVVVALRDDEYPPVAGLVVGMMAVAIFQVHLGNGFFWTDGGFEYPLMWGLVALSFVIRGGGRLSLDAAVGIEL